MPRRRSASPARASTRPRRGGSKQKASRSRSPARGRGARASGALRVAGRGESIVQQMIEHDPTPTQRQALYTALTALSLAALPCLPSLLAPHMPAARWDEAHGVGGPFAALLSTATAVLQQSIGLSAAQLTLAVNATGAAFGLLLLADLLSTVCPGAIAWPSSWQTSNTQCYDEMFCEPTRAGSPLVRRPGNVYSNALYLFGACCVLLPIAQPSEGHAAHNPFWLGDAMFGVMLLVLAALSVVWHSSNAPTSQYIDLWSMDSCIAYLIVRICCLGGLALTPAAPDAAASACAGLFALVIAFNARHWGSRYEERWLHGGCPFAGRTRLQNQLDAKTTARSGYIHDSNGAQMHTSGACLYAAMPVIYMAVPVAIEVGVLGSVGSVFAGTWAAGSLLIGWEVRMWERFCMDGWPPMAAIAARQKRQGGSALLTAAAAVVSPTAILHVFTGFTLLLGYAHARTLDADLAAS